MGLHVLHISNAFAQSRLYKQLILHLDQLGIEQTVYSAVRSEKEAQFNPLELNHLDVHIRNILQLYDRVLYRNKIRKIAWDVIERVVLEHIDIVHAHTLYSDGGVALHLKERFNIPYIIAVRNTDVNLFQKYRPDLRWRRNKILREAEKVAFISPVYRDRFLDMLRWELKQNVDKKSEAIPNGIDPIFLQNSCISQRTDKSILKILYVGDFRKLKNVSTLIEAANIVNQEQAIQLTLVGEGGNEENRIKELIKNEKYSFIKYIGRVTDREKLRQIYSSHDIFTMVSKPETFGLVYIEALSQGLPIIYTKGEGVGGYFKAGSVGEGVVNTQDPQEIAHKIVDLYKRLNNELKKNCIEEAQRYRWPAIANSYKIIYNSIFEKEQEQSF